MPDPLTHVCLTWLGGRAARLRAAMPALLVGALLPDVLYVVPWIASVSHTPLALVVVAYAGALLFRARDRRAVFLGLVAGAWSAVGLDVLQDHLTGGYMLLFPFYWGEFEAHVIDPEGSVLWLPYIVGGTLLVELALYLRRRLLRRSPAGRG